MQFESRVLVNPGLREPSRYAGVVTSYHWFPKSKVRCHLRGSFLLALRAYFELDTPRQATGRKGLPRVRWSAL